MDAEELRKANELLAKSGLAGSAGIMPIGSNMQGPKLVDRQNPQDQISWKVLAEERLQMLNQIRDEMHAWNEAYLKEKERGDRLESHLLESLLGSQPKENQEVKHTIEASNKLGIGRTRWPEFKRNAEKMFAGSPRNEETEDKSNETT